MRKWLPLMVVVAQVAVLAFMAGEREWVAKTGTQILLRTAPIDPRDPMRGDFVRLDYEIAQVPREFCRDGVVPWFDEARHYTRQHLNQRVYAEVRVDDQGLAELISLSDQKPEDGLYLRGRVDYISPTSVRVRYGVEAFFMEQGKALDFENEVRVEKLGVPVNAEVALGGSGLAVLTGYRWEPLGLTIELAFDEPEENPQNQGPARRIIGVAAKLKNHSDEPVAIVLRENGGSFRLLRNERVAQNTYRWVGEGVVPSPPAAAETVVLQPGETHESYLDLTDPAWYLTKVAPDGDLDPLPMGALERMWSESFRIEYAPPSAAESRDLPDAELIRHAPLRSRAFSPTGAVD